MKRIIHIGVASLAILCLSAAGAAAQPSAEEAINVWADTVAQANQVDLVVYTVPPGKQLIIDNVSLRATVPNGERVISANMNLPAVHFFVVTGQGSDGSRNYFTAAQRTSIVVGPNQTIVFRVERNNQGTPANVVVALAGRLIKG
jgi:hypothetical protein